MSFHARLLAETLAERTRFLSIPIIQRAVSEGVPRSLYVAFLAQAYHHVRWTCPLLELALHCCEAADDAYRDGLRRYIEEERGHENWILDDIEAMGGDAAGVGEATPGIPCRAMVGYATYAIEHVSPYALLGMVHVLEGMSALLADSAARAIAQSIGSGTSGGFSYLISHGSLDQEHQRYFTGLVNGVADERARQAIVGTANVIYRLYGDMFRELDEEEADRDD
jgi:pyrroloquinoline quinone (PQQ) biosynthesis protein C